MNAQFYLEMWQRKIINRLNRLMQFVLDSMRSVDLLILLWLVNFYSFSFVNVCERFFSHLYYPLLLSSISGVISDREFFLIEYIEEGCTLFTLYFSQYLKSKKTGINIDRIIRWMLNQLIAQNRFLFLMIYHCI